MVLRFPRHRDAGGRKGAGPTDVHVLYRPRNALGGDVSDLTRVCAVRRVVCPNRLHAAPQRLAAADAELGAVAPVLHVQPRQPHPDDARRDVVRIRCDGPAHWHPRSVQQRHDTVVRRRDADGHAAPGHRRGAHCGVRGGCPGAAHQYDLPGPHVDVYLRIQSDCRCRRYHVGAAAVSPGLDVRVRPRPHRRLHAGPGPHRVRIRHPLDLQPELSRRSYAGRRNQGALGAHQLRPRRDGQWYLDDLRWPCQLGADVLAGDHDYHPVRDGGDVHARRDLDRTGTTAGGWPRPV